MSLHQKLMEVRRSVDYLQKAQKNEQQKFDYVSSSQVLGAVREAMNAQGLLLRPRIIKAKVRFKEGDEKMHFTELWMAMTWVDVESGETETNTWYSQGTDPHEKGVGKALTYAEKFFILKYFNIPTDRWDPDAWEENLEKKRRGKAPAQKQPQKAPEPPQKPTSQKPPTDVPPQCPQMPKGPYKNHGERIKAFITGSGNFKRVLGDEKYYQILKDHGYDKSNKVRKRDDMNAIYKAFKEAFAEMFSGEVIK